MYAKRYILILLATMLVVGVGAQVSPASFKPRSYLYLSAGGGEGNTLVRPLAGYDIDNKVGANAVVGLGYELVYRSFFFSLGFDATYNYYGQTLSAFSDSRNAYDLDGDEHRYSYLYSNYAEKQRMIHVGVPLLLGGLIGDYVYVAAGFKISYALMTAYDGKAQMYTQGTYVQYPDPLNSNVLPNASRWGFYPTDTYQYKAQSSGAIASAQLRSSLLLEVGARIPLDNKKIKLKAGMYAEYGLPFNLFNGVTYDDIKVHLTDYSKVDFNPQTQTQDNLKAKLKYNSLLDSDFLQSAYHNVSAGLKLTVAFDVTVSRDHCNCSGRHYYNF